MAEASILRSDARGMHGAECTCCNGDTGHDERKMTSSPLQPKCCKPNTGVHSSDVSTHVHIHPESPCESGFDTSQKNTVVS